MAWWDLVLNIVPNQCVVRRETTRLAVTACLIQTDPWFPPTTVTLCSSFSISLVDLSSLLRGSACQPGREDIFGDVDDEEVWLVGSEERFMKLDFLPRLVWWLSLSQCVHDLHRVAASRSVSTYLQRGSVEYPLTYLKSADKSECCEHMNRLVYTVSAVWPGVKSLFSFITTSKVWS